MRSFGIFNLTQLISGQIILHLPFPCGLCDVSGRTYNDVMSVRACVRRKCAIDLQVDVKRITKSAVNDRYLCSVEKHTSNNGFDPDTTVCLSVVTEYPL